MPEPLSQPSSSPAEAEPSRSTVTDEVRAATWVVIPAYDEAERIESVLRELRDVYGNVVVVDDASRDGTAARARPLAAAVLVHVINRGQGAALQTGIDYALRRGAEYVITFDADGQHRVEDIATLLGAVARGECDVALGSRFLGTSVGMPLSRRVLLRAAVLFTRWVNRLPVSDAHNGVRALSRQAAERVRISFDRMAHATEVLDLIRRNDLRWKEYPVQIRYTAQTLAKGQSPLNAVRIVLDYVLGRLMQ